MRLRPLPAGHFPDYLVHVDAGHVPGDDEFYYSIAVNSSIEVKRDRKPLRTNGSTPLDLHTFAFELEAVLEGLRVMGDRAEFGDTVRIRTDNKAVAHYVAEGKSAPADFLQPVMTRVQAWFEEYEGRGVELCVEWVPRDEMELVLGH